MPAFPRQVSLLSLREPGPPKLPVTPTAGQAATRATVMIISPLTLPAEALGQALRACGFRVLGPAANEDAALATLAEGDPQVILVDVGSLQESGVRIGRALLSRVADVKVLALGDPGELRLAKDVRETFHGQVSEEASLSRVAQSIRRVLEGEKVFEASWPASTSGEESPGEPETAHLILGQLTTRERQVLGLLAEGGTTSEIAAWLGVSSYTIRTHVANILAKLNLHSRLQAVAFARGHGVLPFKGSRDEASRSPRQKAG